MKVRSELLGIEIPVTECDDGVCIITHDEIDRVLMANPRIQIHPRPVVISENRCVVECTAIDEETGTKIFKVGESSPATLNSKISKDYRATMAYQRAIDRAVIALLQVGSKKCYSSLELNTNNSDDRFSKNVEDNIVQDNNKENDTGFVTADNIPDDYVVLIGNCRGKKYGKIKDTDAFKKFLNYISQNDIRYPDEKMTEQVKLFKEVAKRHGY